MISPQSDAGSKLGAPLTSSDLEPAARRRMWLRALAAATIGTTIEWYDFFLYGIVAALVFPRLFFPESDPFTGTLLAFSTYFVGFAARPLGGVIFGHVGDRLGRKAALVATMLLMGAATVGIGLVPGHDAIGIWGGVLLVAGRTLQGIGIGGEWGGSILLAGEWTDPGRRGFAMSWPQWGGPAGLLLANGALALAAGLTTEAQFAAWGWRVPFLASVALIAVGLYIRVGILETPVFARLQTRGKVKKAPVVEVVRRNWREILLVALMRTGQMAPFYVFVTYILVYGTQQLGLARGVLLNLVMLNAAGSLVAVPLWGHLSDVYQPVEVVRSLSRPVQAAWGPAIEPRGASGVHLAPERPIRRLQRSIRRPQRSIRCPISPQIAEGARPCRPRGVPTPVRRRSNRPRLQPAAWISTRLRTFSWPRTHTRRRPPVSYW